MDNAHIYLSLLCFYISAYHDIFDKLFRPDAARFLPARPCWLRALTTAVNETIDRHLSPMYVSCSRRGAELQRRSAEQQRQSAEQQRRSAGQRQQPPGRQRFGDAEERRRSLEREEIRRQKRQLQDEATQSDAQVPTHRDRNNNPWLHFAFSCSTTVYGCGMYLRGCTHRGLVRVFVGSVFLRQ